jgi:uncharacterized protein YjbI with pentapeptide repeats
MTFFFEVGVSLAQELGKKILETVCVQVPRIKARRTEEYAVLGREVGPFDDLAQLYVEPMCQNINPADTDHETGPGIANQNGVFEYIDKFFKRRIAERDGAGNLFILGDAGMGKTSLLTMLKLAHLSGCFPSGRQCHLIKLGRDTLERIAALEDPAHTILLLDSLDEDPTSFGRVDERLNDLLVATHKFERVLVTCRTQYFLATGGAFERDGSVQIGPYRCPSTYLSLFDDEQVDAYLSKRYPRSLYHWLANETHPRHDQAKALLEIMRSLRFRPLLLAYIEDLLTDSARIENEYDVYWALCSRWLHREVMKARRRGEVTPSFDTVMYGLTLLAFRAQELGDRHFPGTEIARISQLTALGLDGAALDLGGRSLINLMSDGSYRFAHYSIQEFLVARGLVLHANDARTRIFRSTELLSYFVRAAFQSTSRLNFGPVRVPTVRLDGLDLSRTTLNGCDFSEAKLRGCNFARAQMEKSDLSDTDLTGANLAYVNLMMADLSGSDLTNADLTGACLVGAKLNGATFTGATLKHTDLRRAILTDCVPDIRLLGFDVYWDQATQF